MQKLLALSLILTTLLALISAVVILPARQTLPSSMKDTLFDVCTLPCFAGTKVDETSLDDAAQKFSSRLRTVKNFLHPSQTAAVENNSDLWTRFDTTSNTQEITIWGNNKVLMGITIRNDIKTSTTPTLGDLVWYYGSPSCIGHNDNNLYYLEYLNHEYTMTLIVTDLKLNEFVEHITITGGNNNPDCQNFSGVAWHGFDAKRYSH